MLVHNLNEPIGISLTCFYNFNSLNNCLVTICGNKIRIHINNTILYSQTINFHVIAIDRITIEYIDYILLLSDISTLHVFTWNPDNYSLDSISYHEFSILGESDIVPKPINNFLAVDPDNRCVAVLSGYKGDQLAIITADTLIGNSSSPLPNIYDCSSLGIPHPRALTFLKSTLKPELAILFEPYPSSSALPKKSQNSTCVVKFSLSLPDNFNSPISVPQPTSHTILLPFDSFAIISLNQSLIVFSNNSIFNINSDMSIDAIALNWMAEKLPQISMIYGYDMRIEGVICMSIDNRCVLFFNNFDRNLYLFSGKKIVKIFENDGICSGLSVNFDRRFLCISGEKCSTGIYKLEWGDGFECDSFLRHGIFEGDDENKRVYVDEAQIEEMGVLRKIPGLSVKGVEMENNVENDENIENDIVSTMSLKLHLLEKIADYSDIVSVFQMPTPNFIKKHRPEKIVGNCIKFTENCINAPSCIVSVRASDKESGIDFNFCPAAHLIFKLKFDPPKAVFGITKNLVIVSSDNGSGLYYFNKNNIRLVIDFYMYFGSAVVLKKNKNYVEFCATCEKSILFIRVNLIDNNFSIFNKFEADSEVRLVNSMVAFSKTKIFILSNPPLIFDTENCVCATELNDKLIWSDGDDIYEINVNDYTPDLKKYHFGKKNKLYIKSVKRNISHLKLISAGEALYLQISANNLSYVYRFNGTTISSLRWVPFRNCEIGGELVEVSEDLMILSGGRKLFICDENELKIIKFKIACETRIFNVLSYSPLIVAFWSKGNIYIVGFNSLTDRISYKFDKSFVKCCFHPESSMIVAVEKKLCLGKVGEKKIPILFPRDDAQRRELVEKSILPLIPQNMIGRNNFIQYFTYELNLIDPVNGEIINVYPIKAPSLPAYEVFMDIITAPLHSNYPQFYGNFWSPVEPQRGEDGTFDRRNRRGTKGDIRKDMSKLRAISCKKGVLALSFSWCSTQGERGSNRGRILVFDVEALTSSSEIMLKQIEAGENNMINVGLDKITSYCLRLLAQKDHGFGPPGNMISLSKHGLLGVPSGQRMLVYELIDASDLTPVSFYDPVLHPISTKICGDFIAQAEVGGLLHLLSFSSNGNRIAEIGNFQSDSELVNADFVLFGQTLYVISFDVHGCVRLLQYDIERPSAEARKILTSVVDGRLVGNFKDSCRVVFKESMEKRHYQACVTACSDGRLVYINPMDIGKQLAVCEILNEYVSLLYNPLGGLNQFRASYCVSERRGCCANNGGLIEVDILNHFWSLDRRIQNSICKSIGISISDVEMVLRGITEMISF